MSESDQYQRVFSIFKHLQTLTQEERLTRLQELCTGEPELQAEVEAYLAVHSDTDKPKTFFHRDTPEDCSGDTSIREIAKPGTVLSDFRLIKRIGHGGMGEVWEAEQTSLHRRVALKLILPNRMSAQSLAYFEREARAGGRLNHRGVVSVLAVGEDCGLHFIVMEHVGSGMTLSDFLRRMHEETELPSDYFLRASEFFVSICDALHAVHSVGIIHRDIKPTNILIGSDDQPKIADFGLARISDETGLSETGDFAGTYYYMSPEQAAAKRLGLDERTDIFSLGAVFYEALTLTRPFEGEPGEIAQKIVRENPPLPHRVRSRVPRDLSVIAMKALEKHPDYRYQTAEAMREDLRRFLSSEPIKAKPPNLPRRTLMWSKRHLTLATVGLTGLVSLIAITIMSLALSSQNTSLAKTEGEARTNLAKFREMADVRDTAALIRRVDNLWPMRPAMTEELRNWIAEAMAIVGRIPKHRASYEAVQHASSQLSPDDVDPNKIRWQRDVLETLLGDLERLSAASGLIARVNYRLDIATTITEKTIHDQEDIWGYAIDSIADSGRYSYLEIEPILGLIPLEVDPKSGLWEFLVWGSGEAPIRDEDLGCWIIDGSTGVVMVLLPGGSFTMGSPETEVGRTDYEIQRQVTLSPFFISKYELTRGQWYRIRDEHIPVDDPQRKLTNIPIDAVTWEECRETLWRSGGLRFPTEAEWEYGARAGTNTAWWTGESVNERGGNLKEIKGKWRDAYPSTAPVGDFNAFDPNDFGIYGVIGNLNEWCSDWWVAKFAPDAVINPQGPETGTHKVFRGGSFNNMPAKARSAYRLAVSPSDRNDLFGLRPAMSLE